MKSILIHPMDSVAVALTPLAAGETEQGVVLRSDIPQGHKFALRPISCGENIIKYGSPIGHATTDIQAGEWVHTHNVKTNLDGLLDYTYTPTQVIKKEGKTASFAGYRRKNGKVGVRNEIWIIPTVGCVNATAEALAKEAKKYQTGSIDDIIAFPHPFGCSQLGQDHRNTQKALAGLVHHPNACGVLVLGLGCENNNIEEFKKVLGEIDPERVRFLSCQSVEDELQTGLSILQDLCTLASADKREKIPSSELVIGLKCGGSDGLSGITANPVVGAFSDMLVYGGGSTILTEVPEMFGAETILMNRCVDQTVFDRTVHLINDFKQYFIQYHQNVYENPSPGNKEGGITTLEDKSLGCTQKCGSAHVQDVLAYGDPVREKGMSLLSAPGNDLVASTALAVSGAHIVLFTTGRGTPFGCPVPTVKISSNSQLAKKKRNWIDFDAGIVCDTGDIQNCAEQLFDYVLHLASGEIRTHNEERNEKGISIFKDGVVL